MDIILPVSEVRAKLPKLVKQIREEGRHLIITKNGRAAAVMISTHIKPESDIITRFLCYNYIH